MVRCTPMHPSTQAIIRYFDYDHLTPRLQAVSEPFHQLAHSLASHGLEGPEFTVGLRKLLEAKDCMVRAALDVPAEDLLVIAPGQDL